MKQYRLEPTARADLANISDFIAKDSVSTASRQRRGCLIASTKHFDSSQRTRFPVRNEPILERTCANLPWATM
jgi:hypothetical protein